MSDQTARVIEWKQKFCQRFAEKMNLNMRDRNDVAFLDDMRSHGWEDILRLHDGDVVRALEVSPERAADFEIAGWRY